MLEFTGGIMNSESVQRHFGEKLADVCKAFAQIIMVWNTSAEKENFAKKKKSRNGLFKINAIWFDILFPNTVNFIHFEITNVCITQMFIKNVIKCTASIFIYINVLDVCHINLNSILCCLCWACKLVLLNADVTNRGFEASENRV